MCTRHVDIKYILYILYIFYRYRYCEGTPQHPSPLVSRSYVISMYVEIYIRICKHVNINIHVDI